jgi:N-acetylneuraminic acid mutarotase
MKRTTSAIALILALLTSALFVTAKSTQSSADVAENSWTAKTSMPTARVGFGVAVVNGKVYAIGGTVGGADYHWLNTVEEYDPATDTWTTKAFMPTARAYFGVAVYQDKIYVIGGYAGWDESKSVSVVCAINEVYDPATNTWETKTSMPTEREGVCAGVVGGKIYLIGGEPAQNSPYPPLNVTYANEVYDPATDNWNTKASIPQSAFSSSAAVVEEKIYVFSSEQNYPQIYDTSTDTWSIGKSFPSASPLHNSGVAATAGTMAPIRIYVVGGQKSGSFDVVGSNFVYDPEQDVWSNGTDLPTAHSGVKVAVVDDVLYAIGGVVNVMTKPEGYSTQILQYIPFGYGTIPPKPEPFPTLFVATVSVSALVLVGAGVLIYFKKRKR